MIQNKKQTVSSTFLSITLLIILTGCEKEAPQKLTPVKNPNTIKKATERLTPSIPFEDITDQMQINFVHYNGAEGEKWYPEEFLGGAGFFDYNNDGFADIVAVRANKSLSNTTKEPLTSIALFKNNNGQSFSDVTKELNLTYQGYAYGVFAGDYDNDGWTDLYITALGKNTLLKNTGTHFIDVTSTMQVAGDKKLLSTFASFLDVDNDGDLDLLVGNNVIWSKMLEKQVEVTLDGVVKAYSGPTKFEGSPLLLFINNYPEPFKNVNISDWKKPASSTSKTNLGKVLGLQVVDINNDNYLDVIVANDEIKNFAFINQSGKGFSEQGERLGIAYNNLGKVTGAMGTESTWIDGLTLHIVMGNFSEEMSSIYRYEPAGAFNDIAVLLGAGFSSRNKVTFGVLFDDLDLDGVDEFIQANGHVEPDISIKQKMQSYKQSAQVFWQCEHECTRKFVELKPDQIADISTPLIGRALASADIDHDGDLDLLISSLGEKLRLFRNNQSSNHHWLRIQLQRVDNLSTVGTTVKLIIKNKLQKKMLIANRGYLSISENILTFGLGENELVNKIKVKWPDGSRSELCNINSDQLIVISSDIETATCQ